jgi:cytochrome c oxidase cbb3-type subunit 3
MAELPNDFWSGWIIVLTGVSLAGLLWILLGVYFGRDQAHGAVEDPSWDGNLKEGDSAPPLWWFWLILGAMVFSVIYLMLYPGLGSYAGAFRWSQGGQLAANEQRYQDEFESIRSALQLRSLAELAQDPVAMHAAERLFSDHCAACHGAAATGQADTFPDLRDDDWLWGGTADRIEQGIRQGRSGVMVAWQALLGDEGVVNVADYVLQLAAGTATEEHAGRQQYLTLCVACHGPEGDGNPLLGAARLNDDIWLYGGSREAVEYTLREGRNGMMPAFEGKLDELQIRLLVAWLSDGADSTP